MNIKPKTAVLAILALSTVGLATAKAPEIDPARIDSMVAEVLRQADQHPNQTAKPDGQAIRKDVVTRLQTLEILKNEAIKAGLDKDAEVQNQFKNVEAEFYANQYAAYLERQTAVDDAELRRFYDQQHALSSCNKSDLCLSRRSTRRARTAAKRLVIRRADEALS